MDTSSERSGEDITRKRVRPRRGRETTVYSLSVFLPGYTLAYIDNNGQRNYIKNLRTRGLIYIHTHTHTRKISFYILSRAREIVVARPRGRALASYPARRSRDAPRNRESERAIEIGRAEHTAAHNGPRQSSGKLDFFYTRVHSFMYTYVYTHARVCTVVYCVYTAGAHTRIRNRAIDISARGP